MYNCMNKKILKNGKSQQKCPADIFVGFFKKLKFTQFSSNFIQWNYWTTGTITILSDRSTCSGIKFHLECKNNKLVWLVSSLFALIAYISS